MALADRFPFPWRPADYDGRIAILAANGAKVTEVMPGQHGGKQPDRASVCELAQFIADSCNAGGTPYTAITTELFLPSADIRGLFQQLEDGV